MNSYLVRNETDIQWMRELIQRLPDKPTIEFFEEFIARQTIRDGTRLWTHADRLAGFAFIDEFNNLRFEIDPDFASEGLEDEIVNWGVLCMRERNAQSGQNETLDYSCSPENRQRIAIVERHGFVTDRVRTLHYARSMDEPICDHSFPPGFTYRSVEGETEVEKLVALHRAAFGTQKMTVENRLAIMRAPYYEPDLDLVAVAPNGDLAAFCICGFDVDDEHVGYTDPIGTHPHYQRLGLGKAIVTVGMLALRRRGARLVKLGTSSENIAMRGLAETLGFRVVSENWWFTKSVS